MVVRVGGLRAKCRPAPGEGSGRVCFPRAGSSRADRCARSRGSRWACLSHPQGRGRRGTGRTPPWCPSGRPMGRSPGRLRMPSRIAADRGPTATLWRERSPTGGKEVLGDHPGGSRCSGLRTPRLAKSRWVPGLWIQAASNTLLSRLVFVEAEGRGNSPLVHPGRGAAKTSTIGLMPTCVPLSASGFTFARHRRWPGCAGK